MSPPINEPFLQACRKGDILFLLRQINAGNLPIPEVLYECLNTCIVFDLEVIITLLLRAVSLKKEYSDVIQKMLSKMCVVPNDIFTELIFKCGFVPTNPKLLGFAFHNANWCMFEHLLSSGISTGSIRSYRVRNTYGEHHDKEALRRMFYVYTGIYDVIFTMILDYLEYSDKYFRKCFQ